MGGSGPGNFTSINEAIASASPGDTIVVYHDSSPYHEHVVVDRTLTVVGESCETTVLDGLGAGDVVLITAGDVVLSGFTIQQCGPTPMVDACVEVQAPGASIRGNVIRDTPGFSVGVFVNQSDEVIIEQNLISNIGQEGVYVLQSNHTLIQGNEICGNGHCAVVLSQAYRCVVSENVMHDDHATVSLWPGSTHNEIAWNVMYNHEFSGMGLWETANANYVHHNQLLNNGKYGIIVDQTQGNRVVWNTISGSQTGVCLANDSCTLIASNNILNATVEAWFENCRFTWWRQNYWETHSAGPKLIVGEKQVLWNSSRVVPWVNVDWRPSREPLLWEG